MSMSKEYPRTLFKYDSNSVYYFKPDSIITEMRLKMWWAQLNNLEQIRESLHGTIISDFRQGGRLF